MRVLEAGPVVEGHVRRLDRALTGPRRMKADLLREVRDGLVDAAEGHRADGLPPTEAERRAVAEFGGVPEVVPAFQTELALSAARSLGLRVTAVFAVLAIAGNLMWSGAPWVGPQPPSGYLFISSAVDVLGLALASVGALGAVGLWLTARSGRPVPVRAARLLTVGFVTLLGLVWAASAVLFVWSVLLWDAVLSWPPMQVGGIAIAVATVWVARAAATSVVAIRRLPA
jgi:hypothetical protein